MSSQYLYIKKVTLYLFHPKSGEHESFGDAYCAILGSSENTSTFKIGCYNTGNEYICIADITVNNESGACVTLQNTYVTFKDQQRRIWSLEFPNGRCAQEFCGNVAVAMFGASGQPTDSVLVCDVAFGNVDEKIHPGNNVDCAFCSWVVQRAANSDEIIKLGSLLETDDTHHLPSVPANQFCVGMDMKGFEGMVVGMCVGGSRFVVIPPGCRQSSGPQTTMCFYVHIARKHKKEDSNVRGRPTGDEHAVQIAKPQASNGGLSTPAVNNAGFSREQFLFVDRLRDQVFTLTEQIREARQQLDAFDRNVGDYVKKNAPGSITSAQMEYSLKKLLTETNETKDANVLKNSSLTVMRERNDNLQQQLAKLLETKKGLSAEILSAQNAKKDEVVEQDRQIIGYQERQANLSAELDDAARHLGLLKRMLNESNEALQKERDKLKLSALSCANNEQKLQHIQKKTVEESETRNVLQMKVSELKDQLENLTEELAIRQKQIEAKKTKNESDRLYYYQLMDEERAQSAHELSELRKELAGELVEREGRYADEKEAAAREAFERGRLQGFADGQSETMMEAEMTSQQARIAVQRLRSEEETLHSRLKTTQEEKNMEEKKLVKQLHSLNAMKERLLKDNSQLAVQVNLAEENSKTEKNAIHSRFVNLVNGHNGPISQQLLLHFLSVLESGGNIDPSLAVKEEDDRKKLIEEDRSAVALWTRNTAYNTPCRIPLLRPPFRCERVHDFSKNVVTMDADETTKMERAQLIQQRYQSIISQLNSGDPLAELRF